MCLASFFSKNTPNNTNKIIYCFISFLNLALTFLYVNKKIYIETFCIESVFYDNSYAKI